MTDTTDDAAPAPATERPEYTYAEFCRFVQEATDQRTRAEQAEARAARLANVVDAILAARDAFEGRTTEQWLDHIIDTLDRVRTAREGQP